MKHYVTGCILSGYSEKDYYVDFEKTQLPKEYDCSFGLPQVLDQGNLPMCSAVAATTNMEFAAFCSTKGPIDLSEKYVFDLRSDKKLEGMTARDTFDIILKTGVPTAEAFKTKDPYIISTSADQHKIRYYARISNYEQISQSILTYGPAYIALPVCNESETFWKGGSVYGYHAVVFVGWDRNGWILRNSWGKYWGINGYTVFPYEDGKYIMEAWTLINDIVC